MSADIVPIITATAATITICGTIGGLGWWLSGRFRRIEVSNATMLDTHETKDQERHEENLERFSKISVALARLGYKNGGVI